MHTLILLSANTEDVLMFEGFTAEMVLANGINLFVRRSAPNGPPLLLLHGYPQTSAMWMNVAPQLAERYEVICPDLRGYGRSDTPASDPSHATYAKRTMAADMHALMRHFGHDRFFIGAHDRGARVAHRLGLDHPEAVRAMVLLDIAPTREMYANTSAQFAAAYWHWFFLIKPAPFPETLINADPEFYWRSKCITQPGKNPFHPDALAEYLQAFANPAVVHANCEDYRAAYTIDIEHDNADNGAKLTIPLRVLWGADGVIEACFDCLKLWQLRAETVTGRCVPGGHYLAEECPDIITAELANFLQ